MSTQQEPPETATGGSHMSALERRLADNGFCRFVCQLNDKIEDAFEWIGHFVGKYPAYVLGFVVALLIGLSFGLVEFKVEKNIANLWTPRGSKRYKETKFLAEYWGDSDYRTMAVAAVDADEMGNDIMHESYLAEWLDVVTAIFADSPVIDWEYTWTDIEDPTNTEKRTAK